MNKHNNSSRTEKAVKNSLIVATCQVLYLIASFICRTVFIKMLGAEYLGIIGLFNNILTILNFVELGIGSALVYRMYAPFATNEKEKLREYISIYRKAYRVIIITVLCIGLVLFPAIPWFVSTTKVNENIQMLYLLYLVQTLTSYTFAYKKSLLIADQKTYLIEIYTGAFNILMNVVQCILLILLRNFILYCLTNILCNLLNNYICAKRADREYPFILEKTTGSLNKNDIVSLLRDVKGLLLTKITSTVFSSTDNIFISAYIGITSVGILSNYTLLLTVINGVINKVLNSVTASLGNLVATKQERTEKVLRCLFFINATLFTYGFVVMVLMLREFITKIWLTDAYDLPQIVIAIVLLEQVLRSIHYPIFITKNAMGCFSEYRILFIVAAVLNIIMDFLLVKPFGITGLYFATIFCRGITYVLDIYVVYRLRMKASVWRYYQMLLIWAIFSTFVLALAALGISFIKISGITGFILRILYITVVYIAIYVAYFHEAEEFMYFKSVIGKLRMNI